MTAAPAFRRSLDCAIEGCERTVKARGWCHAHYTRWQRHGDPLGAKKEPTAAHRFLHETVMSYSDSECLIWPYNRSGNGYAKIYEGGRLRFVSRLVCEENNGPPPTPKHEAAHSCGRGDGGCVSGAHLRWATHQENMADKIAHGTSDRGEQSSQAKLTEADIHQIRDLGNAVSQDEIAALFGISRAQIGRILRNQNWSWLPPVKAEAGS